MKIYQYNLQIFGFSHLASLLFLIRQHHVPLVLDEATDVVIVELRGYDIHQRPWHVLEKPLQEKL